MAINANNISPSIEKPIKSYLIEFLMLFAAVTLGFFAENLRENFAEKEQAEELALALYDDMKSDELAMRTFINDKEASILIIDSLIDDIDKRGLLEKDRYQYNAIFTELYIWDFFEPKQSNINQIINSGSLRYFKNERLVNEISHLSVRMNGLTQRQERERNFFYNYIQPFIVKEFNLKPSDAVITGMPYLEFSEKMLNGKLGNDVESFLLNKPTKNKSAETANFLRAFNYIRRVTIRAYYEKYLETNTSISAMLEQEYGFSSKHIKASADFKIK